MKKRLCELAALSVVAALLMGAEAYAGPEPQAISSAAEDAGAPVVAMGERGDVAIIWSQRVDEYNSIAKVSLRRPGGEFSAPMTVSEPAPPRPTSNEAVTTGHNVYPDVDVAPNGDVAAIWNWGDEHVRAIYIPADGGPTVGQALLPLGSATPSTGATIGFDRLGNVIALWQAGELYMAYRPRGGPFGSAREIPNPASASFDPVFAVSRSGDAVAVWKFYAEIYASSRPAGGDFGEAQRLSALGGAPTLDASVTGEAIVGWVEGSDGTSEGTVRVAHRPTRGSFGPPVTLGTFTTGTYTTRVAIGPDGEQTVAWPGGGLESPFEAAITSVSSTSDGAWGEYQAVARDGGSDAFAPIYDAEGNLYVGWVQNNGDANPRTVVVASRPPGGSFSGRPDVISDAGNDIGGLSLAAAPDGAGAVAAWLRRTPSGLLRVYAADLPVGDPAGPGMPGGLPTEPGNGDGAAPGGNDAPRGLKGSVRVAKRIAMRRLLRRGVRISTRCEPSCVVRSALFAAQRRKLAAASSSKASVTWGARLQPRPGFHIARAGKKARLKLRVALKAPTGKRVIWKTIRVHRRATRASG